MHVNLSKLLHFWFSQALRYVDTITQCISRSDYNSLQVVWTQLNKQFIGRLNQEGQSMATKIETNILKLYLINATRQNKPDEVKAFFEKNSATLQNRKEWKDWFGKRYCTTEKGIGIFLLRWLAP